MEQSLVKIKLKQRTSERDGWIEMGRAVYEGWVCRSGKQWASFSSSIGGRKEQ